MSSAAVMIGSLKVNVFILGEKILISTLSIVKCITESNALRKIYLSEKVWMYKKK